MTNFIRMTSLAATVAALAVAATPASAATTGTPVSPTDKQATATARVVKPLTLKWKQDLDLGTIVLGAGTWTGADVGIDKNKVFSCSNTNVTCSGAPTTAEYTVTGTNNQVVTVNAADVTLTNQNDNTKTLTLTVDNPGTVNLSNSGNSGLVFDLGGKVTVASDTTDGTYSGTFAVTVNY
jgi:hypothetical protein